MFRFFRCFFLVFTVLQRIFITAAMQRLDCIATKHIIGSFGIGDLGILLKCLSSPDIVVTLPRVPCCLFSIKFHVLDRPPCWTGCQGGLSCISRVTYWLLQRAAASRSRKIHLITALTCSELRRLRRIYYRQATRSTCAVYSYRDELEKSDLKPVKLELNKRTDNGRPEGVGAIASPDTLKIFTSAKEIMFVRLSVPAQAWMRPPELQQLTLNFLATFLGHHPPKQRPPSFSHYCPSSSWPPFT